MARIMDAAIQSVKRPYFHSRFLNITSGTSRDMAVCSDGKQLFMLFITYEASPDVGLMS